MENILGRYDANVPLAEASTIPAPWYTDQRVYDLELKTVFPLSWQLVARLDQLREPGRYVTAEIAYDPVVVVRGSDGVLRGFLNVCRHHAAAVMTEPAGGAQQLRCPYHGWTYSLEGALKGTPDFAGVCNFDRAENGLAPVEIAVWENWVFAKLDCSFQQGTGPGELPVEAFPGDKLRAQIGMLSLGNLHWLERRHYAFDCNWKVFVDNYLDGGYHVPYLHKGLDSVLDYSKYAIENGERFCLQSSPMLSQGAEAQVEAVRKGKRALYYWIYPNFMINYYDGVMDTNLVLPRGVDQTEVIFDFYFHDVSERSRVQNQASMDVGQRIQDEDVAICKSVQRGLKSRAYNAGRLSLRREAGEHLFHRLLCADLKAGLEP